MERVAFLVEPGQQRIGCLLNPESLVARRLAGIEPRRSIGGPLTGAGLRDDRLQFTGGGRTEFDLDLLFDVTLAGSSILTGDVRDLTAPLWNLAENDLGGLAAVDGAYGSVPLVRLIWGKSWNVPGVIVAVAERLERFSSAGVPQRSWLRMRLVRVDDGHVAPRARRAVGTATPGPAEGTVRTHELIGGRADVPMSLDDALTTSSALVALALERSAVAALLAATAATVRDAAGAVLGEIERVVGDTGSASLAALAEVAHEVERVTRALLLEPARRWVGGMVATAESVAHAVARGYAALEGAAGAFGAAARRRVRSALDAVAATVAPLAAAAGRVVRVVRQRAGVLIAAGVAGVEAVTTEARDVLVPLAAAAAILGSALGRAAIAEAGSALDDLGRGLADLRDGVLAPAGAGIAGALTRLGGVVETLHQLGERGAARALQRGVEGLAAASRTLKAAAESLAIVSWRPRIDELGEGTSALRAAVDALRGAEGEAPAAPVAPAAPAEPADEAPEPAEEVRRRAEALRAAATALAPALAATLPPPGHAAADPAAEGAVGDLAGAIAVLEAAAADLDAPAAGGSTDRLDGLLLAVEGLVRAEGPATDALVRRSIADAAAAAKASTAAEGEGGVDVGERLEHVAYRHYGDPAAWRLLAAANDLDDPLRLPAGRALRIVAP